jgi:hypothetical protein
VAEPSIRPAPKKATDNKPRKTPVSRLAGLAFSKSWVFSQSLYII